MAIFSGEKYNSHEMNAVDKIELIPSGMLKQWIKQIQNYKIDPSRSLSHSDVMSPLLANMEDDSQTVETTKAEGEGNVDIIMKTLRNDVLDLIQDVDSHKKPSWILYKLDTLENNIRESCHLQYTRMNHPVFREEFLRTQEKYIVRLIEEIMDDVYQAWNKMKRRKQLGKERSINSVVSVLTILKKEVRRMLQVLNSPYKDNAFVGMKSKSFNECLFQPIKPCVWKKNVEFHSHVTKEINLYGSKSFPLYSAKDHFHSVPRNVHFDERVIANNEDDVIIQGGVTQEIFVPEQLTPLPCMKEILATGEEINLKDELEIFPEKDAYVFSQYAHGTKRSLSRFLSRFVPSRDKAKGTNSKTQSAVVQESGESSRERRTALSDASTFTDQRDISLQKSSPFRRDSECNTSRIFPSSSDTIPTASHSASCWKRSRNFSNRLYSNRRARVGYMNRQNNGDNTMGYSSTKQSESLPAIELIRQQPPQEDTSKSRQKWKPQEQIAFLQRPITNLDVSTPGNCQTDSDSDESYFSCVPSETDFNFINYFTNFKPNNLDKRSETNNFSCKSRKLEEIEMSKRKTRYKNPIVHLPEPEPEDIPRVDFRNDDFCTIAFHEEKPQKDVPSLTPEVSNFSFESRALQSDINPVKFRQNSNEQNMKTRKGLIPVYSYISDSQFSNLCLSANSYENLDDHVMRIDELIEVNQKIVCCQ